MNTEPTVLVMMATYNGAKYVAEQIESILAQEKVNVSLLITDDGSTDRTAAICTEFSQRHPNIRFKRNTRNIGLASNFMSMLYQSDSEAFDYFAFSDQDDFWLPNKLHHAISSFPADESACLYYSDVENVDSRLEPFPSGGREYNIFSEASQSLKLLLTCNWASGCTMVFNSALCRLVQKHVPSSFPRIHDVWVHLIALSCAKTIPDLNNAFILRRISDQNQVGQRGFGQISLKRLRNILSILFDTKQHNRIESAQMLFDCYSREMNPCRKETIEEFLASKTSFRIRLKMVFDAGYKMPTVKENLIQKAGIILGFL